MTISPATPEEVMTMPSRLNYAKANPAALQAMRAVEEYVQKSGLEAKLLELVRLRASQINGCAFCIDMHTQDARAAGESEQRLYGLSVWYETPFYSARERAALAWTEAVTQISTSQVPDEVYMQAREQFPEKELVDLTMAVIAINGWNRLAISFRTPAGTYHLSRRPTPPLSATRTADGKGAESQSKDDVAESG